ncbi:MAG: hypothetical protein AAF629_00495 [Chloroflexota bacterium]
MQIKRWMQCSFLAVAIISLSLLSVSQTFAQDPDKSDGALYEFDVIEDTTPHVPPHSTRLTTVMSASDSDGDGLDNSDEQTLGTDPFNADSDCDYIDDGTEVGSVATPTDTDMDTIIDALESNIADSNQNGTNDHEDTTIGPQNSCAHFTPFAVANDNSEASTLEVRIMGGTDVTSVTAVLNQSYSVRPLLDGVRTEFQQIIQLYDDGTHGDRQAGDHIWTRNQFTSDATLSADSWRTFEFNVVQVLDNGSLIEINRRNILSSSFADVPLGLVSTEAVQTPIQVHDDVQVTSHLVNLVHPIRALEVKQANNLQDVSQQFYQHFEDGYDFLIFFPEGPAPGAPFGRFFMTKNETQNIGVTLFDNTSSYGSAGKLQGAIFMFFGVNGPTLHEVSHKWAARGLSNLGFHQCIGSGHWGPVGVGKGQLGGFDNASLVDNGNGTYTVDSFGQFANGGDSVDYVPLENYLGGFIAASSVPNISVPVNVDCNSFDYSVSGKVTFAAGGMNTVSITDIQNELGGPRIPDVVSSQKAFTAALVLVTEQKATASEMAFFNNWSTRFGAETGDGFIKSFQEGTGNLATMDTRIAVTLPENTPPNLLQNPIPIDGAINVSTNQFLQWQGGDADGDVLTYTIAFGAQNPPPIVATTTQTHYNPTLMTDTTYYWMITATDGMSTSVSSTWYFTTSTIAATEYKLYLPLLMKVNDGVQ